MFGPADVWIEECHLQVASCKLASLFGVVVFLERTIKEIESVFVRLVRLCIYIFFMFVFAFNLVCLFSFLYKKTNLTGQTHCPLLIAFIHLFT